MMFVDCKIEDAKKEVDIETSNEVETEVLKEDINGSDYSN
jgi:hypothetical protein